MILWGALASWVSAPVSPAGLSICGCSPGLGPLSLPKVGQPHSVQGGSHTQKGKGLERAPSPARPCSSSAHHSFRGPFHRTLKQIKHLLFRFFSVFFFFTKTCIHTQGMVGPREDTHSRIRSHIHTYTNTFLLGPRQGPQKPCKLGRASLPSPMSVFSPTPSPSAKLVLCGAGDRAGVEETPETEGSWQGQRLRGSPGVMLCFSGEMRVRHHWIRKHSTESTRLLHQGTEMVDIVASGGGSNQWEAMALRTQGAGSLRRYDSPALPTSLQTLGRATPAEAKFTFLRGAWGCVQHLGFAEPRIVVTDRPT